MTRINVGINPEELCDKHLNAEYRELPRLWNFVPKGKAPPEFKLGTGHVLWCVQYKGMLADRYKAIVAEKVHRNAKTISYPNCPDGVEDGARPSERQLAKARKEVQVRINERLKTMKNPKWTNRSVPDWVDVV